MLTYLKHTLKDGVVLPILLLALVWVGYGVYQNAETASNENQQTEAAQKKEDDLIKYIESLQKEAENSGEQQGSIDTEDLERLKIHVEATVGDSGAQSPRESTEQPMHWTYFLLQMGETYGPILIPLFTWLTRREKIREKVEQEENE